jgi:hypothetical protein
MVLEKNWHPFGEADYKDYVSATKALKLAVAEISGKNFTATAIDQHKTAAEVVSELKDKGFKRVAKHFYYGKFAVVFEGMNHQIIRIANETSENPRLKLPFILQPIDTINMDGYNIEILPKIHTLEEIMHSNELQKHYGFPDDPYLYSNKMALDLLIRSANNLMLFFDCSAENIGIIKDKNGDNIPVIIDAGALRPLNTENQDTIHIKKLEEELNHKFKDSGLPKFSDSLARTILQFFGELDHVYENFAIKPDLEKYFISLCRNKLVLPERGYAAAQANHLKLLGLDNGIIPDKAVPELSDNDVAGGKYKIYSHTTSLHARLVKAAANQGLDRLSR